MLIPFNQRDFKAVAKKLRKELSSPGFNLELSHGVTLDLLSRSFGYSDYNAFCGLNKDITDEQIQTGDKEDIYLFLVKGRLVLDGMSSSDVAACLNFIETSSLPLFSKAYYGYIYENIQNFSSKKVFYSAATTIIFFSYIKPYFMPLLSSLAKKEIGEIDCDLDALNNKEQERLVVLLETFDFSNQELLGLISKTTEIPNKLIAEAIDFSQKIYNKEIVIDKNMGFLPLLMIIKKTVDENKGILDLNAFNEKNTLYQLKKSFFIPNGPMSFLEQNIINLSDNGNGKKYEINIFEVFSEVQSKKDVYKVEFSTFADFLIDSVST